MMYKITIKSSRRTYVYIRQTETIDQALTEALETHKTKNTDTVVSIKCFML